MAASPVDPALERSFRGHKDAITAVDFNPNMKQLVSGGLDGCVPPRKHAWEHITPTAHARTGRALKCAWLVSLSGRCVFVWNFKLQLRAFRFVGHKDAVLSVASSPTGNLVASASKDRSLRLWMCAAALRPSY